MKTTPTFKKTHKMEEMQLKIKNLENVALSLRLKTKKQINRAK